MTYRMGSLNRGDMPRGGFFGDLARGIGHVVGGAIGGFVAGGPRGAIAGAVGGTVSAIKANISAHATDQVGGSDSGTPKGQDPASLVRLHQLNLHRANVARLQGGKTGPGGTSIIPARPSSLSVAADGTVRRRRRRIRWTNTRALGRAERRIHMAVKHMTRYIKWVHPKKDGHAAPKFGRKRK